MDWLPKQCSKHKWAPKTYQSNLSTIQNLIVPYIGNMEMQKLKPYHLENLYSTLSKTPCGQYIEGKKQKLTSKQKQRLLSGTTIHEVHRLLHTAFLYAVEWGILLKSPVPLEGPKKTTQERSIWRRRGNAGGPRQHGGPYPSSGGPPDSGWRTAGRRSGRAYPGGHRL